MLGLLLLFQLPLVSPICVQCASPTLSNQWQLTGLPTHPDNLLFISECNTVNQVDPLDPNDHITIPTCSGVCFEMVIAAANQYHFVRGCHSNFIEAGVTEQQVASEEKCFFSRQKDQLISSEKGDIHVPGVAVIHFALVGDDTTKVNAKFNTKTLVYAGAATADPAALATCSEARAVTCVKSMYYDGTGEDNNKESCTGGYCTSIEGYLNGRKYIERGCAPISPYTQDTCVTMRTNSTFLAGLGEGGPLSRVKRSLNVILDAKECFCSSDHCNTSATHLRFALVLSMVILAATTRFLY